MINLTRWEWPNVEASKDADKFDMFGDNDDDDVNGITQSEEATLGSTSASDQNNLSATEKQEASDTFDSSNLFLRKA